MSNDSIFLCGLCKLVVPAKCMAICCDGKCGLWFHASCVNISDAKMKKITDLGDSVLWLCSKDREDWESDKPAFPSLNLNPVIRESAKILEALAGLASRMSELEAAIRALRVVPPLAHRAVFQTYDHPSSMYGRDLSASSINSSNLGTPLTISASVNVPVGNRHSTREPVPVPRLKPPISPKPSSLRAKSAKKSSDPMDPQPLPTYGSGTEPESADLQSITNRVSDIITEVIQDQHQPVTNNTSIHTLQAVPVLRRRFLYVSRLHPTTTRDSILAYIGDKLTDHDAISSQIICFSLAPRRNNDDPELSFISFKVGTPVELYPTLADRDFWPTDVTVRDFRDLRRARQSKNVTASQSTTTS